MSLVYQRYVTVNADDVIVGYGSTDVEALLSMMEATGPNRIYPVPPSMEFSLGDIYKPDTKEIELRPRTAVLNGTTLSNLPIPCRVTIDFGRPTEAVYEVDDGIVELTFPMPGTYSVQISAEILPTQTFEIVQS